MLLRSTSTPVAQSLFPDSPNREITKTPQAHYQHFTNKDSNLNVPFGSSAPISYNPSSGSFKFNPKLPSLKSLKRAQSDSNLEGLISNFNSEEFHQSVGINTNIMLRSEPSLSIYNSEDGFGEKKQEEKMVENDGLLTMERSVTTGVTIGSGEFSFGDNDLGLIEEEEEEDEKYQVDQGICNAIEIQYSTSQIEKLNIEEIDRPISPPMYHSTGFGMDGNGVGGGGGFGVGFKTSCSDQIEDVEDFYKRLVSEDPFNPLYLRNYAQLLQSKRNLSGAEDLYFRATFSRS